MQAEALFEKRPPSTAPEVSAGHRASSLARRARRALGRALLHRAAMLPLPRPQSTRHSRSVIIGRSWWFRSTADARWVLRCRTDVAKAPSLLGARPAGSPAWRRLTRTTAPGMRRSKAGAGKRRHTKPAFQPLASLRLAKHSAAERLQRSIISHSAYHTTALRFHRCARARLLEPTKTPPWTPATTNSAARASN